VEISRGRSVRVLHEWGMVFRLYSYFETMINDATFGGYHKFGSEARILPGFEEAEETKTPALPKKNEELVIKQQSAVEESNAPRMVALCTECSFLPPRKTSIRVFWYWVGRKAGCPYDAPRGLPRMGMRSLHCATSTARELRLTSRTSRWSTSGRHLDG